MQTISMVKIKIRVIACLLLACFSFLSACSAPSRSMNDGAEATIMLTPASNETVAKDSAFVEPAADNLGGNPDGDLSVEINDPLGMSGTDDVSELMVWVPPQFDPAQTTPAGEALQKLFDQFMQENPDVRIVTRVKSTSDSSSALNTLISAKNAAPDVLPSLVILDKGDMESAVQKGLILPIETGIFNDSESWYSYARQSAAIDNQNYGIPIAGDALVLVYRPAKTGAELTDWPDIVSRGMRIAFVPSSSNALFPTFIYKSLGGKIIDDEGQAWLDQKILEQALNFFQSGAQSGVFPPSLTQIADQRQNWQLFTEGTVNLIIAQFSTYRHYEAADISAMALPSFDVITDYPLSDTWMVSLVENDPAKQGAAVRLAERMAEPVFSQEWVTAAGYLPVRQHKEAADAEETTVNLPDKICSIASLVPGNSVLNRITSIVNNAVSSVLTGTATPANAAQTAVQGLQ